MQTTCMVFLNVSECVWHGRSGIDSLLLSHESLLQYGGHTNDHQNRCGKQSAKIKGIGCQKMRSKEKGRKDLKN